MTDTVTGLYRKTHYALLVLTRVNTDSIQVRTESLCGHPCVTQNLGRLFTEGKGRQMFEADNIRPYFLGFSVGFEPLVLERQRGLSRSDS